MSPINLMEEFLTGSRRSSNRKSTERFHSFTKIKDTAAYGRITLGREGFELSSMVRHGPSSSGSIAIDFDRVWGYLFRKHFIDCFMDISVREDRMNERVTFSICLDTQMGQWFIRNLVYEVPFFMRDPRRVIHWSRNLVPQSQLYVSLRRDGPLSQLYIVGAEDRELEGFVVIGKVKRGSFELFYATNHPNRQTFITIQDTGIIYKGIDMY